MIRRPPRSTRTDTLFPYTTLFRSERLSGGRYVDVEIDRLAAARYGLNIADVQTIVSGAIGGANVARTVEGLARYPVNVRYPREIRDSFAEIRALPVLTTSGEDRRVLV